MSQREDGLILPARVERELAREAETNDPAANGADKVPPRMSRAQRRSVRIGRGKVPARLSGGPQQLHGRVWPVDGKAREVRVPFPMNMQERALLSIVDDQETPDLKFGSAIYTKRVGRHDDGALRFEFSHVVTQDPNHG